MRGLAALGLCLTFAFVAPAGAQTTVCSTLKLQASGAYFQARATCLAKALAKGLEPDAACITKALSKLGTAFGKAEAKGPCVSLADLAPAEDILTDALDDGFDTVVAISVGCCDTANEACFYKSAQDCLADGSTPGPPGSACRGDGTCGPFPGAATGVCCDGIGDLIPNLEASCVAGPDIVAGCIGEGFPLVQNAACHPELGCVAASQPVRTSCTSGKVKALGRYFSAVAKCHAKALKKSEPVDIVCLGKAESKLSKAFTAAEKKDDCLGRDDFSPALTVMVEARLLVAKVFDPETTVCCAGSGACYYTATDAECTGLGGIAGAGECDSNGTCGAPPLSEGPCCEGATLGSIERCVGGPSAMDCTALGGEFDPDALCLQAQVCID